MLNLHRVRPFLLLYVGGINIMNILVTGAKGMVGTALVNNLKNIRDGKIRQDQIFILMRFLNMI